MIDPVYCQVMAQYNQWQNTSLMAAAASLGMDSQGEEARWCDRGAFFQSIQGTLNHLYWGDAIWMHRLAGLSRPEGNLKGSPGCFAGWNQFVSARTELDQRITDWTAELHQDDLAGDLSWFSAVFQKDIIRPRWLTVAHFFNHQTHHRGQVHAMLTAAGAAPGDTDLVFLAVQ